MTADDALPIFRPAAYRPASDYRGEQMLAESVSVTACNDEELGERVLVIGLHDKNGREVVVMRLTASGAEALDGALAHKVALMHRAAGKRPG